jgi:hypothetical protein
MILPYIDQAPLYNQYNHLAAASTATHSSATVINTFAYSPANGNDNVVSQVIPMLICPSDPGSKMTTAGNPYYIHSGSIAAGKYGAKTSYEFNVNRYSTINWMYSGLSLQSQRPFGHNGSSRITDFKDGVSNTVMVSEGTLEVRNGVAGTWGYEKWVGNGIDFGYSLGINYWPCCSWTPPMTSIPGRLSDWGTPGSQHVGGCHILLGDGAVRFVSENLNRTVQSRLATMADGNETGEF